MQLQDDQQHTQAPGPLAMRLLPAITWIQVTHKRMSEGVGDHIEILVSSGTDVITA